MIKVAPSHCPLSRPLQLSIHIFLCSSRATGRPRKGQSEKYSIGDAVLATNVQWPSIGVKEEAPSNTFIQPPSSTCLPSSPIVTLCPTQEKVKHLPLHDKSPTPQAWQIVSSATMQWILDASCTINLTSMPTGSDSLERAKEGGVHGVSVFRGRSRLSPSKYLGRGQNRRGSRMTPTQT